MKNSILFISAFISIFILKTNAQTYGLDNTDPSVFTKYKIPNTDLKSLWFNTSLNFSSNKQDYTGDTNVNSYYNSNFGYNLRPSYYLLKETDNKHLYFKMDLSGHYSHSYSENHYSTDPYLSSSKNNMYSTSIYLNFLNNNYLNSSDVFYSLSSSISVSMSDAKNENNNGTTTNSYTGNKNQYYNFLLGFGFGKLRNVTPVVSAIRFQERLKQVNLLNKDLSNEAIEGLAQQFSRQSYFSSVHERPNKYFWQSIDDALSRDGISLNGLNMYSSSYLMETTGEVRFLRQEGCIVGINAQLQYQNTYQAYAGNHQLEEEFYTLGNMYINYSHQLNLNSQVNFNLSISGGPNVIANQLIKQLYSLDAEAGYNYELTDRIVTSLSDEFSLDFRNESVQQKILRNNFILSVNYFIEDNMSFNFNYNWQYFIYKDYNLYNPSTNNNHSVNVGFTYYIDRGILIK